ncbi:putative protein SOSEKI [Helianthus annuus]|nr:putative protein SOSEKI [Helianthus annuus]
MGLNRITLHCFIVCKILHTSCSMKYVCQRSLEYQQRRPAQVHEMEPEWQQKSRKVLVVCFLCKNRQLEHAHFIEVALASSEGLFKRRD